MVVAKDKVDICLAKIDSILHKPQKNMMDWERCIADNIRYNMAHRDPTFNEMATIDQIHKRRCLQ